MPRTPSPHQRDTPFKNCLNIRPPENGNSSEIRIKRRHLDALMDEGSLKLMPDFPMAGNERQLTTYVQKIYKNQSLVIHHNPISANGAYIEGLDTIKWLWRAFADKKPLLSYAPVIYMAPESDYYNLGTYTSTVLADKPIMVVNQDYFDLREEGKKLRALLAQQRSDVRKIFRDKI